MKIELRIKVEEQVNGILKTGVNKLRLMTLISNIIKEVEETGRFAVYEINGENLEQSSIIFDRYSKARYFMDSKKHTHEIHKIIESNYCK